MQSTALSPSPESAKPQSNAETRTPIVGVGASSGGLEAFIQFLRPLPEHSGLAFVLIQHLDRAHPSSLPEILGRATSLPVMEAADGVLVEPDHVYVIPAESDITVEDGRLRLESRVGSSSGHYPIDFFFQSLAADLGSLAVGVVLSGSGTDGTQGLLSIKQACGLTFAQEEISAQFGSMPHSAIVSGAVDFILKPDEMFAELSKIGKQSANNPAGGYAPDLDWFSEDDPELNRVFALLQQVTRIDFTHYKRKTVNRRVLRRMAVLKIRKLSDYVAFLQENPGEISKLFREILINVTSFFREPESFETLIRFWRDNFKDGKPGQPVRVWVAACATGEEAYSIAICLMELLSESELKCPLQVFGTDVNETALEYARTAIYPESIINDVRTDRLTRFFTRVDRGYQINKSIRECCIFARHDLNRDPPFSRLDLVSCRNVLIYMGPVLQKRIIPMFHYSLKPGGLLMLGSAEALAENSDLFKLLDKQHKLFQRQPQPARFRPDFQVSRRSEEAPSKREPVSGLDLEALMLRTIRDRFAADGVVVNRDMRIVLFRGHTGLYFDPAPGNPSFHLMRMIREDLAFKVEGMVSRAAQQSNTVKDSDIVIEQEGRSYKVSIEVIPLQLGPEAEAHYLVSFASEIAETSAPSLPATRADDAKGIQFERELREARAHLRAISEEHEVSVEELRAANEEVRSTNEELQSTNEELGTAKEELQSTNEELSTVNQELSTKNTHLAALNDDLRNLFNGASLPMVMVDGSLRLRRFTPAAESFLNLLPSDIGRVITDIRLTIEVPEFKQLLEKTLNELSISTLTVMAVNNRWYTVTLRPYRTVENRIDGAVITFTDVDALKRGLNDAQDAREYAESLLETLWEPLVVLDSKMHVQRATTGFYRTFQVTREETEGRSFYELGAGQWNVGRLRTLLEDILPKNTSFQDFEIETSFPGIGFRSMRMNARRIRQRGDGVEAILLAIDDVTDRRQAAEIRYRRLFETAKDGILELDGESGDILDVNPFFLHLCNCSRSELLGKKLWETSLFESAIELRDLVGSTKRRDAVRFEAVTLRGRDGKRFSTELVCNRYMVADEAVIQCNIRDVTERTRTEEELRRSNEDLQQFAYAASHDLQEPLRMVGAYTQLLGKKYRPLVDEEGAKYIEVITSSVRRMEQLIKDLLIYSQSAAHESAPALVNAEKALGLAAMNLQLAISDTGTILTNEALPVVRFDQIHFVQIFQNLIANAIKYRKRDEAPVIRVSAERTGSSWVFSVSDNGLGFDEQYADHIFGVFKRLHGKDYPGTGIGLSICKKIIERGGGRIWAKSKVGVGSTFSFSIPDSSSVR